MIGNKELLHDVVISSHAIHAGTDAPASKEDNSTDEQVLEDLRALAASFQQTLVSNSTFVLERGPIT